MAVFYKTTNLVNGKVYYGVHGTAGDGYLGSGIALLRAIKRYGKKAFKREDLLTFPTLEEAFAHEQAFLTEELVRSKLTYNMGPGGRGGPQFSGRTHSVDTRKSIGEKSRGRRFKQPPEAKAKISLGMRGNRNCVGRKISEETRQKIRDKLKKQVREVDISSAS